MLGGISGGDPFEIVVALKDLAAGGFEKLRGEIKSTERTANSTNMSGFLKQAKNLEKDAAAAAGAEGKGGVGGLASGLTSLAGGPVTLAVAGLGALAGAGVELTKTYDEIEVQEKSLAIAAKDHGIAQEDLNKFVDQSITSNEQYGIGATDTRAAITKLTEAGMSLADQQQAMGPIADLAKAKQISLADAAKVYELAIMGNAKAVKEYGIVLPKMGAEQKAVTTAQKQADTASKSLTSAQNALKLMEDSLAGKHKLTAAEALKLKVAHEKLTAAQIANKAAQDNLKKATTAANDVGSRSKTINDAITKAVGDQRNAVTPLEKAQAQLGDMWQRLATTVGPPLEALFAGVLEIVGFLIGKFVDLIGLLGRVGSAIANSPIGGFIRMVANFVGGALQTLSNTLGSIGNLIPHFASGGVVNPKPGGQLIVAGEAGEREYVIPESKLAGMGGGGSVVHTHIYLDGAVIADVVDQHLGRRLALTGSSRLG